MSISDFLKLNMCYNNKTNENRPSIRSRRGRFNKITIMQKMNFRNWPSWLKGGVIYVLIFLGFMIFEKVLCQNNLCQEGNPYYGTDITLWVLSMIIFLPLMPFDSFLYNITANQPSFISNAIAVVFLFIVGSLVGWIIGKIKSRLKDSLF